VYRSYLRLIKKFKVYIKKGGEGETVQPGRRGEGGGREREPKGREDPKDGLKLLSLEQ
jgi:hypothetical protein